MKNLIKVVLELVWDLLRLKKKDQTLQSYCCNKPNQPLNLNILYGDADPVFRISGMHVGTLA